MTNTITDTNLELKMNFDQLREEFGYAVLQESSMNLDSWIPMLNELLLMIMEFKLDPNGDQSASISSTISRRCLLLPAVF